MVIVECAHVSRVQRGGTSLQKTRFVYARSVQCLFDLRGAQSIFHIDDNVGFVEYIGISKTIRNVLVKHVGQFCGQSFAHLFAAHIRFVRFKKQKTALIRGDFLKFSK